MNARHLLWIDCTAGAVVGIAVLLLHEWLSALFDLPEGLVLFMGIANVVYACGSFSLAIRRQRPLAGIQALALANVAWAGLLMILFVVFAETASPFGLAQFALEALFVGGLGIAEWRNREALRVA